VTIAAATELPLASVARFGSRSRTVGFEQVPTYTSTAYVVDGRSPVSRVEKLPLPAQSRLTAAVPLAAAAPALTAEIVAVHVLRIVAALVVGGIAATTRAAMASGRRTRDRR
jgi:hypothetical protein